MSLQIEWVLQDVSVRVPEWRYEAHWWWSTEGETDVVSQWNDLQQAIAWARARAPRVRLNLWLGPPRFRVTYSAGTQPLRNVLEWHEPVEPSLPLERNHSGDVTITEFPTELVGRETFGLVSETRDGRSREMTGGGMGLSLDEALRMARGRSKFVVVGTMNTNLGYAYYNAGTDPLPLEPFPLWPPRP